MSEDINDTHSVSDGVSRRSVLKTGALLTAASAVTLAAPHIARAQNARPKVVYSTPFTGQDSFSGTIKGLEESAKEFDVDLSIVDAAFDIKKQNDQIATIVSSKPDALIVLAFDPVGSSKSVQLAVDANIPVFVLDSYIPGVLETCTCTHDNFNMGQISGQYVVDRLNGKGKIAALKIGHNDHWSARHLGMEDVIANHPGIELVGEWTFDLTGKSTPRSASDSLLAANPDLDAIWCAWDGGGMEASLAALAAGRGDSIFTTGIDGGSAAFEVIKSGGPFSFTVTQDFYIQARNTIKFVRRHLDGQGIPRIINHNSYGVDKAMLDTAGELANTYDQPGVAKQLGWQRG